MSTTTAHLSEAAVPARTKRGRSSFYLVMGLVAVAIVLAGFGPGVFQDADTRRGEATPLIRAHGVVFGLWFALYLAQTPLERRRQTQIHRRLGWAAIPLTAAVIGVGYATTIDMGRRGFAVWWHPEVRSDVLVELVHPFFDLLSFTVLVSAAILWRRQTEAHKRLMLLATIGSMMGAPLAHLLGYAEATRAVPPLIVPLLGALYFASAIRDRLVLGRIHPVSLWGGLALFALANLRAVVIGPSETWQRFAAWLIR